jgi:hypothetical protein
VFIGQQSDPDHISEDGQTKSKATNPNITLQADSEGYPILPSWESIKGDGLLQKKYLIGRYLGDMYGV